MNLLCSAFRPFLVVAILVIGTTGCSVLSGPATPSDSTESSMHTENPVTESTGTETPRPPENGKASLPWPQLPIGGDPDDRAAEHQCVRVTWLQPDVLPEEGVTVTGIQITPSDVFRVGGRCGGLPACNLFSFRASTDSCSVAVTALGTGLSAELTLKGKSMCASARESSCRALLTQVEARSIKLTQPDDGTVPGASSTSEATTSATR